ATCLSILIAVDQFRLSEPLVWCYFGAICAAALYGGIRNFIAQKSFSSNAVAAMTLLFPVIALISHIVRMKTLSDYQLTDKETFMAAGVLIPALCMLLFAVWIMGVISSALATRMEIVGNLMVCLILFLTGMMLHYFAARVFGAGSVSALLCTSLVPNWQLFWMADVLSNRIVIPAAYFVWTVVYSVLYCAAWIGWAFFLFQDSELARDTR
ncbi:MAG: hypothetical protein IKL85_08990, partial [Lentisphaeria bacterium]|nr:hypothetical protein [Lentisphaeria bacterium]